MIALMSVGNVRSWVRWRRLYPVFLVWGRRRWRTWLGLYLDKKNSFSSESSLSSSRVLKDRGRYPYRMAFLMTAWSRFLSSALRYPHQAGLAYRSCETSVARVTSHNASHWAHERECSWEHKKNERFWQQGRRCGGEMLGCHWRL